MKRAVRCPYCGDTVVIDDRAALGCSAATKHIIERCPLALPKPSREAAPVAPAGAVE